MCPEQLASKLIISFFCFGGNRYFLSAIISKAKVNSEFPANTAVASPNFCVRKALRKNHHPYKEDRHELMRQNVCTYC